MKGAAAKSSLAPLNRARLRYRNASYTDHSVRLQRHRGTISPRCQILPGGLIVDCHCSFAVSAPPVVWKATSFTPNPPSMVARH